MRSPDRTQNRIENALPSSVSEYMTIFRVAPRLDEPLRPQGAEVMRDEVLRTARDPREVADAKLLGFGKRHGESESRRVAKATCSLGCCLQLGVPLMRDGAEPLGHVKIQTEEIATVVLHSTSF